MSVAKPLLEYVDSIKVGRGIRGTGKQFKTILRYSKSYFHLCVIVVLLSALKAYLLTLEPIFTSQIIDDVVVGGQYNLLADLVLKITLSVVGVGIVIFAQSAVNGYYAELLIRDFRTDYYSSLEEKSFSFYDSSAVGELISRATVDLQSVQTFLATWISNICDAVFIVVAVFAVMYSISPTITLVALAPMPILAYFQITQFRLERPLQKKLLMILGKLGAYVQQNIIGMKNVHIFRLEKDMDDGFNKVEGKYLETVVDIQHIQASYVPSTFAVLWTGIAAIYVYGHESRRIAPIPTLEIGQIILFARYIQRLRDHFGKLGQPYRFMGHCMHGR